MLRDHRRQLKKSVDRRAILAFFHGHGTSSRKAEDARLFELAYAFAPATKRRVPPLSAP